MTQDEVVADENVRIRPTNGGNLLLIDRLDNSCELLSLTPAEAKALKLKLEEWLKDPGKCRDCTGGVFEGRPCHYCHGTSRVP